MRHSLAHIMAEAVQEMFPEVQFGIGPVIENGFYYDFDLPRTLIPEDLIGLKIQAISNDPKSRFAIDAPDIQRILQIKIDEIDMELVRMYFELFSKEDLLDEWLDEINR